MGNYHSPAVTEFYHSAVLDCLKKSLALAHTEFASVYYAERKPKDKNGGGLGTRLASCVTKAIVKVLPGCGGIPHVYFLCEMRKHQMCK